MSDYPKKTSWLAARHPAYERMCDRWKLVSDFYLAEVANEDVAKKYLHKRFQGESDGAYRERLLTTDYTPHLGTLLDTLAGMLFAVEARASRVWSDEKGKGLGDPDEPGTIAHRLWNNADGGGAGWATAW